MDLTHRFTVPASVEDTWAAFNDIESVAGCFPGATVTSFEGDDFTGSCKVKLGPISLVYSGTGHFVERDDSAHRFAIEAKGKDKRGNGTAGASVTAVLTPGTPGTTDVQVNTDLAITGKPAQFGRGVMQDVSDRLLQQFVDCLETKVASPEASAAAPVPDVAGGEPSVGKHAADLPGPDSPVAAAVPAAAPAAAPTAAPTAGRVTAPYDGARVNGAAGPPTATDDALDLGTTVLPILLKAYWKPLVGGLVGLYALAVLKKLLRRRK